MFEPLSAYEKHRQTHSPVAKLIAFVDINGNTSYNLIIM